MTEQRADPTIIGDFRIEKRLGAGGMGVVYLARQMSLDRLVALKVLGPSLTYASDVARLQREAQAAARLKHPGIANVYFVGQDAHICYIVMEYIEGISLRQVMRRLGTAASRHTTIDSVVQCEDLEEKPQPLRFDQTTAPLELPALGHSTQTGPWSERVSDIVATNQYIVRCSEIIRDAALALDEARRQRVVHRDLKPENMIVDRHGKVFIIDFGIARFFEDATLTCTGQLVGTPMYMSPEQVAGRIDLDHRSDIYSLGIILYELLTWRPPFQARTREEVLRKIVTKPLLPVTWHNPAVPRDLESITHRATSKDPDERYQTAEEFAADLQRYLDRKPVLAKPYRYKFDPQEIEASRPRWIILAASVCFLNGIFAVLNLGFAAMALAYEGAGEQDESLFVGPLILLGSLPLGYGLLSGRQWARIGLIAVCILVLFVAAIEAPNAIRTALQTPTPISLVSLALVSAFIVLTALLLWGLMRPRTAQWFRNARTLRAEYRDHKRSVKRRPSSANTIVRA